MTGLAPCEFLVYLTLLLRVAEGQTRKIKYLLYLIGQVEGDFFVLYSNISKRHSLQCCFVFYFLKSVFFQKKTTCYHSFQEFRVLSNCQLVLDIRLQCFLFMSTLRNRINPNLCGLFLIKSDFWWEIFKLKKYQF